jgi:hypothetical protein
MKVLLNQLKMLREIYPNNENILKIYGLACEQGEQVLKLEKELVELRNEKAELEKVVDDLLNNSSFSVNFPFEHDELEKLRGK